MCKSYVKAILIKVLSGRKPILETGVAAGLAVLVGSLAASGQTATETSAQASLDFLRDLMDRFHQEFYVYSDVSAPSNHFVVLGAFGPVPVVANGSWSTDDPVGASMFRFELADQPGFGGFYFLNGVFEDDASAPAPNWGTDPDAGVDLTGAVSLRFKAKGATGEEVVEFFMGGVGHGAGVPFPDSSPKISITGELSTDWQEFSIDVSTSDLSYVLGGFGWVATSTDNPGGAVFYVDDIYYDLSPQAQSLKLDEPRFVRSFETEDIQATCLGGDDITRFDLAFRNLAFTYDNALVLLAFLSSDDADDLRRARLIGDAFVYAGENDRTFVDGRLRNAYLAGDMVLPPGWHPNGLSFTMGIPGFWCEEKQTYIEMEQDSVDVGNNTWAAIALLALYQRTGEPAYLDTARRISEWVRTQKATSGTYRGFTGGIDHPEGENPVPRPWASGEHNLDVFAAFRVLGNLEIDPTWTADAEHAETFVAQLWDPVLGCYFAGTIDSETRNESYDQIPVDVQTWSMLALHDRASLHPEAIQCAETHHRREHVGFDGFDFNTDRDGIWFEGTAQMAAAYLSVERPIAAAHLQRELQQAQNTMPYGDGEALWAATVHGLTTGFGFSYLQRSAIATAAWNVFAQRGFDPYYQRDLPQALFADGFESGDVSAWAED